MSLRCDSLYTFPKADPVLGLCRLVPTGESRYRVVPVGKSRYRVVPVGESRYRVVPAGASWWNPVGLEMWVTILSVVCRIVTAPER
jgi:hypothetical protein